VTTRKVAREYGFKCVAPSRLGETLTFTLPYAGATRIRFEGLPIRLSVRRRQTPLASKNTINKAIFASQIISHSGSGSVRAF
jgi:hypothetical protein